MISKSSGGAAEPEVLGESGKDSPAVEGSWEWTFAKVIKILAVVMLSIVGGILAFAWPVCRFIAGRC